MRHVISMLCLCLGVAACGSGVGFEVAPPPSSAVNPGGDEIYCPSGQQPPCD